MDKTDPRKVGGTKEQKERPSYTLTQLLDGSDYSRSMHPEDREWIDAKPVGRELL